MKHTYIFLKVLQHSFNYKYLISMITFLVTLEQFKYDTNWFYSCKDELFYFIVLN